MRLFTKIIKTIYVAPLADLTEFLKFSTLLVIASTVTMDCTDGYQLLLSHSYVCGSFSAVFVTDLLIVKWYFSTLLDCSVHRGPSQLTV